ncbi:DUF5985 family protein [Noviluteimonas dokdonensis]|uniref:DUF5985 family protein n=1 Tax=Noviluteimonas dokdonensis TaxID=414050 RepID=UPI00055FAD30|nr:DUF5985 family protein [Lysobacter dokdonensis]
MQPFLLGMISMGCAVAALLFLKFWKSSRDQLFLFFSAAFAIEAINRGVFAVILQSSTEYQPGYVLARLLSFSLILVGIIYKNSTPRP